MDNNENNNLNMQPDLGDQIMIDDTPTQPKNNLNLNQGLNIQPTNNVQSDLSQPQPVQVAEPQNDFQQQQPDLSQNTPMPENNQDNSIFSDIQNEQITPQSDLNQPVEPINPQPDLSQPAQEPIISEEPKKKKSKGPMIVIILLVIIVLGLAGYIVYDKYIPKDSTTKTEDTPKKDTTQKTSTVDKTKDDYYIELGITDINDGDSKIYNKILGKFLINGDSNDVTITKNEGEEESYSLNIGKNKIFTIALVEHGFPYFIALMDEKYVAVYFGAYNIELYDLNGNKIETFGNSLGELTENSNISTIANKIIEDDKNFTFYDCKLNNGPGTETLTEYSVKFENGKYNKEEISVKQNTTCLVGS